MKMFFQNCHMMSSAAKNAAAAMTLISFFSLKRLISPVHVNILPNVIGVSATEDQALFYHPYGMYF